MPEEIDLSNLSDPKTREFLRTVQVEDCRVKIRRGGELAKSFLWEYVGIQWPKAIFDEFQRDIIESGMLGGIKEIAIKGCTSPGKGFAVAVLVNCWFDIFYQESKVILCSSSIDHCMKVIFGEVTSVRRIMKYPGPGKVMSTQFQDHAKHYLVVANPKTGEGFSGQHSAKTLMVFDEASGVPDMFYQNAGQQAALIVALSNPRVRSGWFFDLFVPAEDADLTQTIITPKGPRRLITVGGKDCRNVREKRLKEPYAPIGGIDIEGSHFEQGQQIPQELFISVKAAIPNQMDLARYLETMANPDPMWRDVFGDGKFPKEDSEFQLFLPSWFDRHHALWTELAGDIEVDAFGLDLAATSQDGDSTVLAAGGKIGLKALHNWRKSNTTETLAEVTRIPREEYGIELTEGHVPIAIDQGGIGKALSDSLIDAGVWVIRVWSQGNKDINREMYDNRRAEVYGEFSARLNPLVNPELAFALPPSEKELVQELCAHDKIPKMKGFGVTPKSRYRGMQFAGHVVQERLGRSPDRADAVCYLWLAIRHLDMETGAPMLNRPLLLITPEEEAAAAVERAKAECRITGREREEREHEEARRAFQAHLDELLPIPADERIAKGEEIAPYPDFLR